MIEPTLTRSVCVCSYRELVRNGGRTFHLLPNVDVQAGG